MNHYLLSITAFCAIFVFAMPVQADVGTFQIDFGATVANNKNDNQLDTSAKTGQIQYFFSPVVLDKNQPFGEAAFIQRIGNLGAAASSLSYEDKSYERANYGGYSFNGAVYSGDLFLMGSTTNNNPTLRAKTDTSKSQVIDASNNSLSIGFYFLPLSTIAYSRSETSQNYTPSQGAIKIPEVKATSDAISIKTLLSLKNGQSLVLNGSWTRTNREHTLNENNKIVQVGGAYYLNPQMYLNLGHLKNSGDNASSEGNQISYGLGFTTDHRLLFSIQATKFTAKNSGVGFDSSSLQTSVHYRF